MPPAVSVFPFLSLNGAVVKMCGTSEYVKKSNGLRGHLFSPGQNPAIGKLKAITQWAYINAPDISMLGGWRLLALRIFGFALILSLISFAVTEKFSIASVVIVPLVMMAFFGFVYIRQLAGLCYGFLGRWEKFK